MLSGLVTLSTGNGKDVAIRPDVLAGIQEASASTGIDFSYLMAQANRESSFNPTAQAKSSSAAGLYQFIEQTWLGVVKAHGAEYGQDKLAASIERRGDGRFVVADAATRQEILDLRREPGFAAAMAAEHAADNKAKLEDKLGREATGADLYMAHFLGISGAIKFLRTEASNPDRTGASLFPKGAAANPSVFYTPEGRARSVAEIYQRFEKNISVDMATYAALEDVHAGTDYQMAAVSSPGSSGGNGRTAHAVAGGIAGAGFFPGGFAARVMPVPAAMFASAPTQPASSVPGSSVPGSSQAGATPEIRGAGRVGSLLSPLMLVTLAALPVGREEPQAKKDEAPESARSGSDEPDGRTVTGATTARNDVPSPSLIQRAVVNGLIDPLEFSPVSAAYTS